MYLKRRYFVVILAPHMTSSKWTRSQVIPEYMPISLILNASKSFLLHLVPVVQRVDNALHRLNRYPVTSGY